ncbi:MAG: hypothetical protein J4F48_14780, partial [Nitrospinae bacterium]|nr:hypothetical protein [Nitrospinota bacterium]
LKPTAILHGVAMAMALCLTTGVAHADPLDRVMKRLEKLEAENQKLREEIEKLKSGRNTRAPQAVASAPENTKAGFVKVDTQFGYEFLDPTTNVNRKQRLILISSLLAGNNQKIKIKGKTNGFRLSPE